MKARSPLARAVSAVGIVTVIAGLAFALTWFAPRGEPGTRGFYRWDLPEEQMLVYANGEQARLISLRVVLTAAGIFLLAGGTLIHLSRRLGLAR
jgi:hypothetical protein